MKRRRNAGKAGAAPAPSDPAEGDGHAACRARLAASEAEKDGLRAALSEQGGRLDAAEAAAAELRAANEALAREHAALKQDHDVCLFFARRRDFGAELPAGVLLNIMDRAPSSKCASVEILAGRHLRSCAFDLVMFIFHLGAVLRAVALSRTCPSPASL